MSDETEWPPQEENHDRGLAFDLDTMFTRRRALQLLAGASIATLAACSGRSTSTAPPTTATATNRIPQETAGPFPANGQGGARAVNVLDDSGIVRRDIRSSFGNASATAAGVPLTVKLKVLDVSRGGAPFTGAAVYVWHCDAEGRYSLYSEGVTGENYLRGVQIADENGDVEFLSTFPGAYPGRFPHIHFQVFESEAAATASGTALTTSQLALPQNACEAVYATADYPQSTEHLQRTPLARDGVFREDGGVRQLAATTGSVADGYTASLTVPV